MKKTREFLGWRVFDMCDYFSCSHSSEEAQLKVIFKNYEDALKRAEHLLKRVSASFNIPPEHIRRQLCNFSWGEEIEFKNSITRIERFTDRVEAVLQWKYRVTAQVTQRRVVDGVTYESLEKITKEVKPWTDLGKQVITLYLNEVFIEYAEGEIED